MDTDDKKDLNRDPFAPQLTLVRSESRAVPQPSPKLELIVNPGWRLYEALKANDPRRAADALARGADVNERDPGGRTPLFEAVLHRKDPAIAELLVHRGADVRARDHESQTPLHGAASFGEEAHLRVLLKAGAEIDARDARGVTPLHCAVHLGRINATTFLVGQGADVSICDHKGRVPLALARRNHSMGYLGDDQRQLFERLLRGFMTVRVVEAGRDSLTVQVETLHLTYPAAWRQATERGTLAVPCGAFPAVLEPGYFLKCHKDLTQGLNEVWREARRRDLGIEPVR